MLTIAYARLIDIMTVNSLKLFGVVLFREPYSEFNPWSAIKCGDKKLTRIIIKMPKINAICVSINVKKILFILFIACINSMNILDNAINCIRQTSTETILNMLSESLNHRVNSIWIFIWEWETRDSVQHYCIWTFLVKDNYFTVSTIANWQSNIEWT